LISEDTGVSVLRAATLLWLFYASWRVAPDQDYRISIRAESSSKCAQSIATEIYRVFLKMDHIGDKEWIKGNKKFLYHFEIFAVVFELEKETSKPICG